MKTHTPEFEMYPMLYETMMLIEDHSSPIFTPKKHTVESYRSQQRKAKQRRRQKK